MQHRYKSSSKVASASVVATSAPSFASEITTTHPKQQQQQQQQQRHNKYNHHTGIILESTYQQYWNVKNGIQLFTTGFLKRNNKFNNNNSNNNNSNLHYSISHEEQMNRSFSTTSTTARRKLRRSFAIKCLICCIVTGVSLMLIIANTLGIRILKTNINQSISSSSSAAAAAAVSSKSYYRFFSWQRPSPSPSPPPPIPSTLWMDTHNISVIIMNHARPQFLLYQSQLLSTLMTHPNIQTIYILHSNHQTAFNNSHLSVALQQQERRRHPSTTTTTTTNTETELNQKIQHIDAVAMNEQLGLAIRFHYCVTLCNNTNSNNNNNNNHYVLHIDDDMEFTDHSVITTLLAHMHQNPHRMIGHYGRAYSYFKAPFRHGYDTRTIYGNVEVVLTKIVMMEQALCQQFFQYTHLIHDLLNPTTTATNSNNSNNNTTTTTTTGISMVKWNGEDIFMNLVANHYYNVPINGPYNNYAIPNLDVWDIIDTMATSTAVLLPQQQLRRRNNSASTIDGNGDVATTMTNIAISGNMDRNRIWMVGFVQWYSAYQRAQAHTKFRGLLWYTTKQRLSQLPVVPQ